MISISCILANLENRKNSESKSVSKGDAQGILWQHEIKENIRMNILGRCNYTIVPNFASHDKSSFRKYDITASFHMPNKREVKAYQQKPTTITKGNPTLLVGLNCSRMRKWASEKEERWMVAPDHPGQDRDMCMNYTRQIGLGHISNTFYDRYKTIQRTSYLLKGQNAIIDHTGAVMFECGYYKGTEIYELRWDYSRDWDKKCKAYMTENHLNWGTILTDVTNPAKKEVVNKCSYKDIPAVSYKKVFVISSSIDSNFHHLLADSLARLPRYLGFLKQNPDIMIHVRNWEDFEPMKRAGFVDYASKKSRRMLLELLGFPPSRVVALSVTAETVYIPRAMSWADALKNPTEVRLLSTFLIQAARKEQAKRMTVLPNATADSDAVRELKQLFPNQNLSPKLTHTIYDPNYDKSKKNLVLLIRAQQSGSWGNRVTSKDTNDILIENLKKTFSDHNIVIHSSDAIYHPDFCMACEIMELTKADILLGMHGAGMTKQMFMPAGAVVFELSPHLNDAQMPLCGYYGNLAAMYGHHHYLYAYDNDNGDGKTEPLDPNDVTKELQIYYKFLHSSESASMRAPSFPLPGAASFAERIDDV